MSEHGERFRRVRGRGWGYDPFAVDAFFARVEAARRGWAEVENLTAEDVEQAEFPLVRHGYRIVSIDHEVGRLAAALRPGTPDPRPAAAEAADIVVRLRRPAGKRFARAPLWGLPRGYQPPAVDGYLDQVARALQSWPPVGLDAADTARVCFPVAARGYRADEVEALLDRVTLVLRATAS